MISLEKELTKMSKVMTNVLSEILENVEMLAFSLFFFFESRSLSLLNRSMMVSLAASLHTINSISFNHLPHYFLAETFISHKRFDYFKRFMVIL